MMLCIIIVTSAMGFWMMWMLKSLTERVEDGSIMSRCNYTELAERQTEAASTQSDWDKEFNYENCVTNGNQY